MSATPVRAWRCQVCGFVHEGSEPPALCPVCGAPAADFTPEAAAAPAAPAAAVQAPGRIVILGGGIAGVAAAEGARQTAPGAEIVLVSAEPGLPYYRLNLTRLLAGEIGEDALPLHPAEWYAQQRIELRAGTGVRAITPDRHDVELADGARLAFDKLILTTGARAFMPSWPGANRPGVLAIRSLEDARQVLRALKPGLRCLCVGGGILGLETAGALARRGAAVELLEGSGWLMPRQLTRAAADVLATHVRSLGIRLRPSVKVREIVGADRATGVLFENGDLLPADLVLVTTGIRSNLDLATAAGLTVRQGVVVDDSLVTSHPDVLAAGDVAEHRGVVYGLWPAAQYQGAIAGMNAAGARTLFGGIPRSNVLKVLGLHVFSVGQFDPGAAPARAIEQSGAGAYDRFVFQDGRLTGAIVIGRHGLDAALLKAVEDRRDFSELLAQNPTADRVANALGAGGA